MNFTRVPRWRWAACITKGWHNHTSPASPVATASDRWSVRQRDQLPGSLAEADWLAAFEEQARRVMMVAQTQPGGRVVRADVAEQEQ